MNTAGRYATLMLPCVLAGGCLAHAGGLAAQDRTGKSPFSIQTAIEEVRRSPFHASPGPGIQAMRAHEVPQPLPPRPVQITESSERGVSGGNIFFFSLPVAAVLDVLAFSGIGDEGYSLDPLISLGAIAAPTLVARLTGARTVFALVGSAMGFGSGALFAKAFDKFGVFLAPAIHTGATAVLSILGDRTR
ncbi:MAG: hypothetical protein F4139_13745 [Gemmatimonadetes bacterium]|nr:hypothetical protein [Gemmatimonadota bacterium]MYK66718.1 hypothetical protein [Gemmatimonadota bacterium]